MSAWGPLEWGAVGSVAIGIVGTVALGVAHAIKVSYRFGRTDQEQDEIRKRLDKVEAKADIADTHKTALELLQQAMTGVQGQLTEMRDDIKHLLTGGARTTRRRGAED